MFLVVNQIVHVIKVTLVVVKLFRYTRLKKATGNLVRFTLTMMLLPRRCCFGLPEVGKVLTSGQARAVNSYNVVASDVATRAGEEDARDSALRRLAEEIRTRLAIYFQRRDGDGTTR